MAKKPRSKWSSASKLKILAIVGVGLAVAVVWLLPDSKSAPLPKYSGPVEHVTSGIVGEYNSLIIIAQDRGYFRDNGVAVTTKAYDSGATEMVDLLAGKIDTISAADFVGVRNSLAGEDLKIISTIVRANSFYMAARQDHGISQVADLRGKRIGVTLKTSGEFYLGAFLTYNHLSINDVRMVNGPPAQLVDLLNNGQLDAIVSFEPNIYKLRSTLGDKVTVWSVQNGQTVPTILYSTGKFTTAHPEAIKRYLRALVESEQFVKNHDRQARTIVARKLNYDTTYINYIWPKLDFGLSLDEELLINMDDEARWLIENHLTTASEVPNYLNFIYFDGLEAVKPGSITIIH